MGPAKDPNSTSVKPIVLSIPIEPIPIENTVIEKVTIKANFDIKDYLIPKVAGLIELGNESEKSSSSKEVNLKNGSRNF